MPNVLIRHLPDKTLKQARKLAKAHRHSVQEEIRSILVEALGWQSSDWTKSADILRDRTAKYSARHTNSVRLIRENRDR